jgi:transposase
MDDILEVCCGLDIHKDFVEACLLTGALGSEPEQTFKEFTTMLSGLSELRVWLEESNCRYVAMESTGVYWFPVFAAIEGAFDGKIDVTVTNPKHMKNIPGRKTDKNDARWIGKLLRAGLLEKSYIPPANIRDFRDLTRYRRKLVQEANSQKNRVEKHLQACGFKLSTCLTDIFGASGMAVLKILCERGKITPAEIKASLFGTAKKKESIIREAVNGVMNEHQRRFLKMLMSELARREAAVAEVEEEIKKMSNEFESAIFLVASIPCIDYTSAVAIVSEIGTKLDMFPTAGHLCAWAGLTPGNNLSAGKKHSTRVRKGNTFVKGVMCQCAWAATRHRGSYFANWYWNLQRRKGQKKAVIALARKMLSIVYVLLTTGEMYDESHFAQTRQAQEEKQRKRLIAQAAKLGLTLAPVA